MSDAHSTAYAVVRDYQCLPESLVEFLIIG